MARSDMQDDCDMEPMEQPLEEETVTSGRITAATGQASGSRAAGCRIAGQAPGTRADAATASSASMSSPTLLTCSGGRGVIQIQRPVQSVRVVPAVSTYKKLSLIPVI